ncbi:helix-turn-helix transcriptional regulator [Candidatus Gracilibacteria bacterium]|nr:helix-turn-helix transcriptional regulator [Candidatus Gracilibacteria bacterium]
MPKQFQQLDRVFQALADPTRRAVVERLANGPTAMSELARPFAMALPSFAQHLDVLEACGLVQSQKQGRVRTYRLAPEPLQDAEQWMAQQRAHWERRLDQLDAYLNELKEQHHEPRSPSTDRLEAGSRAGAHCGRAAVAGLAGLDDAGASEEMVYARPLANGRLRDRSTSRRHLPHGYALAGRSGERGHRLYSRSHPGTALGVDGCVAAGVPTSRRWRWRYAVHGVDSARTTWRRHEVHGDRGSSRRGGVRAARGDGLPRWLGRGARSAGCDGKAVVGQLQIADCRLQIADCRLRLTPCNAMNNTNNPFAAPAPDPILDTAFEMRCTPVGAMVSRPTRCAIQSAICAVGIGTANGSRPARRAEHAARASQPGGDHRWLDNAPAFRTGGIRHQFLDGHRGAGAGFPDRLQSLDRRGRRAILSASRAAMAAERVAGVGTSTGSSHVFGGITGRSATSAPCAILQS